MKPDARARTGARWPLGPRAPAPVARLGGAVAGALVAAAVGVALSSFASAPLRAASALALVALAGLMHRALTRTLRPPRGWIVADERGLRRVGDGRESRLADWREAFGATVLARADRRQFTLALTSPGATRLVAVRSPQAHEARGATTLLDRATTAADSDLLVDDASALSVTDAEGLLRLIAARSPGALDRLYLVDATGEPVVLDRAELRVGGRRIDLSAPLEWRAFFFQELGTQAASVCQATWVRQGDGEVVLVAPMPAESAWLQGAPDARLVQASQGEPPPRELRRAIDRAFMIPLRRALERAPRVSRAPSAARQMPEGRA